MNVCSSGTFVLRTDTASPRLDTLIATPAGGPEYRWEVRLQGDGETVFFAT